MDRGTSRVLAVLLVVGVGCAAPGAEEVDQQSHASMSGGVSGTVLGKGLRVRPTPSTSQAEFATLANGQSVTIGCQIAGESVQGTVVWDWLPDYGGYVSDAFVWTGHDGFAPNIARCAGDAKSDAKPPPPPSTSNANGSSIVAEARKHLGYVESGGKCNTFSAYFGRSGGCQEWCSDFVNYVWLKTGYAVDGINGYSGTIAEYGIRHGTFKKGPNANAAVGDAVLWGYGHHWDSSIPSKHVGIVTEVFADGSIKVLHGNFGPYPYGVKEGILARSSDVGTGAPIYGFVSPSR